MKEQEKEEKRRREEKRALESLYPGYAPAKWV
jgi:hypothetical protein